MRRTVTDIRHVLAWLVFLIWAGVFGAFYFSGDYVALLNPQFGWLLLLGFVLSLMFFLVLLLAGYGSVSCSHEHEHEHEHRHSILRMLILLVPVLFVINYDSWKLGSFAFDKRAVGLTRFGGDNAPASDNIKSVNSKKTADLAAAGDLHEVSLVEIHNRFEQLVGKKVSTQGMYMSETPGLAEDSWVIFRFLVVCCAADAQPMAVMVKGTRPANIADETWLQVNGTLKGIELNGQPAVVIEAEEVMPIEALKVPYMTPNFR